MLNLIVCMLLYIIYVYTRRGSWPRDLAAVLFILGTRGHVISTLNLQGGSFAELALWEHRVPRLRWAAPITRVGEAPRRWVHRVPSRRHPDLGANAPQGMGTRGPPVSAPRAVESRDMR